MKNRKIHIDHLFRNAFSHLNMPISDSDLNEVNKKMDKEMENSPIHNFELPINENDWLLTKTKLNLAQEVQKHNNPFSQLEDFELPIADNDWDKVKSKLNKRKKRRIIFFLLPLILTFTIGFLLLNKSSKNSDFVKIENNLVEKNKSDIIEIQSEIHNQVKIDENSIIENNLVENNTKNNNIENVVKKYKTNAINNSEKTEYNLNINQRKEITKIINDKNPEINIQINDRISALKPNYFLLNFKKSELIEKIGLNYPIISSIKKPKIYIGLNSEVLNQKRLLSNKNPKDYNNIRNNTERSFISSQNGLVFGVDFKKTSFQTGINHLNFQTSTTYNYGILIHDSIPMYDPNGKLIGYFLFNPRYKQTRETVTKRMSSILIPINVQKSFKINHKNSFITGIGINTEWVYLQKQNKYLDPSRMQHLKGKNEIYNQFNIQTALNLGIRTKLYRNWALQSGISGNYQINNAFKKSQNVKENPYNYGINLKLLYYLK